MRISLRARIALLVGLAVVVVAAAVAVTGRTALARSVDRQVRAEAAGQARQLAAVIDPGGGAEHDGDANLVDISDPSLTEQLVRPGLWVATMRPDGRSLHRSKGAPAARAGAGLIARCRADGSATAMTADAAIACQRVGTAASPRGFVVAGRPRADARHVIATTTRALAAAVVAGGLASVLIAWALAGQALRPVRLIARTARSIREGDLDRRVGYRADDELGALAAELDRSFAALAESLQRQERFVADASHELKTPLTAARANVELLRRWAAEDPDARREAIAAIERSIARMSRIVADLLELATGSAPAERSEAVALDDVLLEAARDTHARTLAPPVIERLDRAVVRGDRGRLLQLVSNLVDNAAAASPPDAPVRLSLSAEGGRARLSVRDDGPGIAPDDLPHVFDRFYRGGSAEPGAGAGLGLAIARAIARGHAGEVEVESAPGAGATFTIDLPLADPGLTRDTATKDTAAQDTTRV